MDNLAGAETTLEQQIKLAEATLASEESILAKLNKELVATFSDVSLLHCSLKNHSRVNIITSVTAPNTQLGHFGSIAQ